MEKELADRTHAVSILAEQAVKWREELQAAKRKIEEVEEKAEEKWKAVSGERKKWQAKGKALPVKMVTIATQTDHILEPKALQMDDGTQTAEVTETAVGTQTDVGIEELEKGMERKRERKGKGRAKDSGDTVMKDGSDNSDSYREMYEDLSGYEDEDEALVAAPPATKKKQAAPRSAA